MLAWSASARTAGRHGLYVRGGEVAEQAMLPGHVPLCGQRPVCRRPALCYVEGKWPAGDKGIGGGICGAFLRCPWRCYIQPGKGPRYGRRAGGLLDNVGDLVRKQP